jgi:SPP1 family predicted phage head-tail adaptor
MSGLNAGAFDRRIRFERKAPAGSFMGAGSENWVEVATVWASVLDVLPSNAARVGETVTITRRPTRIRIRFREDITTDMRVIFRGRVLKIVAGPAELGFREGLEFMAEDYSTQGNAG